MKKNITLSLILCVAISQSAFSQSVSITPAGDEILITKYGSGTPNLAGRQSSGSSTTPAASTANMGLATFAARGHSGTSFTGNRAAINMDADQAFTATAQGTRITFFTTLNGTTTNTERVRIDNTGKVGIGSTDPLGKLQINHDTDANDDFPHIRLRQLSDLNFGRLRFENSDGTRYFMNKISLGSATPSLNNFRWTYGTSELMRLTGDGNVGIGTAAPDAKLFVVGTQDNNGTVGTFKVSNGANDMIFDSNEIDVSGNNQLYLNNNSTGNVSIGTGGGKVGIGTNTPTAKLDVEGDIVMKKSTVTVAGTYNALNRSSASSIYFNTSGTINLNGIDAGVDGLILYIFCGTSTTLVIGNENVGASATDRIATHTGANVTISGRGGATLIYESTSGRWRVVGVAQ